MFKVFYSWQSDLPNNLNRNLIQSSLEKACKQLKSEEGIVAESVIDRDTKGIAGAPNINDVILAKIRDSDAFVADVSLLNPVSTRHATQPAFGESALHAVLSFLSRSSNAPSMPPCPNPNVLVELGYAMAQLGNEALVLVVNTYYGAVEDLPFDLRFLRTLTYRASPHDDLVPVRKALADHLGDAIRSIASAVRGDPVDTILHERTQQVAGQARGLLTDLARHAGRVESTATEVDLVEFFESLTQSDCTEICAKVNPNAPAPLLLQLDGEADRRATWLEYMKYWRVRSGSFTSKILAFSPFLKREHAALLMRVEHSAYFAHLDFFRPHSWQPDPRVDLIFTVGLLSAGDTFEAVR